MSNNLTPTIVRSLANLGGLLMVNIANKVVCFGAENVTIFQGLKIGVNVQFMNKQNPFIVCIHCMAHQCNLAMQIFSSLSLIVKNEAFFSFMYTHSN